MASQLSRSRLHIPRWACSVLHFVYVCGWETLIKADDWHDVANTYLQ